MKKIYYFVAAILCAEICYSNSLNVPISDSIIEYKHSLPSNTYHQYCKNVYSQNGEDGILEQILKELGVSNGTFCEFGASDGIASSNTYNLIKNHNFKGIAIEADHSLFA